MEKAVVMKHRSDTYRASVVRIEPFQAIVAVGAEVEWRDLVQISSTEGAG
jgi:hypothetical protein